MKTIAWDVDDVLNDLMRVWFKQKWVKDHDDCTVAYYELFENPPHRLLGVDADEYLLSLDAFRTSSFYQEMEPVQEVMDLFIGNGSNFRHIALTATPRIAASSSAQWVFRHYGTWIPTFHFVPSVRSGQEMPEYEKDKGDFLKWLSRVDLMVDDSESNILGAEKAGCRGLLIPRPWNKSKLSIGETLSLIMEMV